MAGTIQTLQTPPPVSVQTLLNAIRVGLVNLNHPGTITYDPLTAPPPPVSGGNGPFDGKLEIRITKGVARYTANFTPPSAPLPDVGIS